MASSAFPALSVDNDNGELLVMATPSIDDGVPTPSFSMDDDDSGPPATTFLNHDDPLAPAFSKVMRTQSSLPPIFLDDVSDDQAVRDDEATTATPSSSLSDNATAISNPSLARRQYLAR